MSAKKIEVKDGSIVVPIYEFTDGRFCVDTMLGETRKRITRTSLEKAKVEARKLIAQIKSGRSDEEPLSRAQAEDYRHAKRRLAGFNTSLLSVVEEWISYRSRLTSLVTKKVAEVVEEFLSAKELEGVSRLHLADRQSRLRRFSASFSARIDQITAVEIERWLNGIGGSRRTKSNYRNALLQLFRFARTKRYLPKNEPTAVDEIAVGATRDGQIHIYSAAEMSLLLYSAPQRLKPFFALGAFGGLRSQEIMRLEWKDIRFEQGFIEVSAAKAKTASRRLAEVKDAARVALEMGNSPSMLFRNYRELVTEQEALEWFSLTPESSHIVAA